MKPEQRFDKAARDATREKLNRIRGKWYWSEDELLKSLDELDRRDEEAAKQATTARELRAELVRLGKLVSLKYQSGGVTEQGLRAELKRVEQSRQAIMGQLDSERLENEGLRAELAQRDAAIEWLVEEGIVFAAEDVANDGYIAMQYGLGSRYCGPTPLAAVLLASTAANTKSQEETR